MEPVPVRVTWKTDVTAGKTTLPPAGKRFTAVSRFPEDEAEWATMGGWTVVFEFDEPPAEQGNPSAGRAHFLRQEAPHDRLQRAGAFDLYALTKHVGRVEVGA